LVLCFISHFGLLANLLSVPLMEVLVAPSAVVSLVLMPFGAVGVGLLGVHIGLQWIVFVAGFFLSLRVQYLV
jgi:competence protein ComEC